jgi:O-antigen/teichoic acid export membrane protein
LSAFALPEISRRQLAGRTAIKVAVGLSGVMVLADLVWGLALVFLPAHLGEALLGDSWSNAQEVLPASLLGIVAIGFGLGASTLMVARGFAKDTFWMSALMAPGFLVFGLFGLHLWGAPGAALGLSLVQVVVTPLMWWRILLLMRRERLRHAAAPGDAVETAGHEPDEAPAAESAGR